MWQIRASKLAFTRLNSWPCRVVPESPAGVARTLSVGGPSVLGMADNDTVRHLRVVRADRRVEVVDDTDTDAGRAAYWARLEALRAERQRLRAG